MKKSWMVSMHHSITTTRWLKDRCASALTMRHTARSSSRWGFRFPWKPDLSRFSPRSGPSGSYVNSRSLHWLPVSWISHNRCVFTFLSNPTFRFFFSIQRNFKISTNFTSGESIQSYRERSSQKCFSTLLWRCRESNVDQILAEISRYKLRTTAIYRMFNQPSA